MASLCKIAITGGAGYIGSALSLTLAAAGYDVRVIDSMMYGRILLPGVEVIEADVRDRGALRIVLADVDAVIHMAFLSLDRDYPAPVPGNVNDDAFLACLDEAKRAGVRRFIFPSSCSVYGRQSCNVPVDETADPQPLSEYARAKARCEHRLLETLGIERVILRPATVFGRAPRQRLDLTINRYTVEAFVQRQIRVDGGDNLRPSIHIDDLVRLYRVCLEAPSTVIDGRVFNAAYDARPLREIATRVAAVAGPAMVRTRDNLQGRNYMVSSERVAALLGFSPKRTLEDGVADLVADLEVGRLTPPFDRLEYSNLVAFNAS